MFHLILVSFALYACFPYATAAPGWPGSAYGGGLVKNVTVFVPPTEWPLRKTPYARTVLLNQDCEKDEVLLTTWAQQPPGNPYWYIYESKDHGRSWSEISKAYFHATSKSGGGRIEQPYFFELAKPVGKFPAGTILLTGNAIPADLQSTNIEVLASYDKGHSWEYVSTVAVGGAPNATNGATPVWEPFIMMYDNQIGVFYSDQRDPAHGQKLAHQTSTDLVHWGPVVDDVAYANYTLRPGMTTIAKMGNGKYIFSYELGFAPEDPINAPYAVHYRIADSPFEFQQATPYLLKSNDGKIPSSSPYTVWTPVGGPKGTIVMSDGSFAELFINKEYGDLDSWVTVKSGHGIGYSKALTVLPDQGESIIWLTNGGMYGFNDTIVTGGDFKVPGAPSREDTISACRGRGFTVN
ncbi:hypothetical protein NA57DRAFT_67457 [Rhizodiscina lignyota]|uniref:Glycoside hydrolase family 93 protein n=1 Tax=Rhizodiscina lignyota TaxID=1504668 RepID=A0A9P4M720_9PEZI|nr:hypothetical protein NA57DRAFT_67457 [Rhizodiscina lignyota]